MRSAVVDVLPAGLRRSLKKLGQDLSIARRRRNLTTAMRAERVGVGVGTFRRAERGDPKVSMGVYAMAMFVLGFGDALARVIDPGSDDQGLLLETSRLPKRVRIRKAPTAS